MSRSGTKIIGITLGDPQGIGAEVIGLRVGLGFVVAVVTGLVVHGQWVKHGTSLRREPAIHLVGRLKMWRTPIVRMRQ